MIIVRDKKHTGGENPETCYFGLMNGQLWMGYLRSKSFVIRQAVEKHGK